MKMKLAVVLASTLSLCISTSQAFAGKPERDKADELKSSVDTTAKSVTTACGCPGKVTVDWSSYASADGMARIGDALQSIEGAATGYCQKAADKQAFCANVSEFIVKFGEGEIEPALSDKKITLQSTDSSFVSAEQIRAILDKF